MNKEMPLTGAQSVAHAMRQINPDVVAAFPITPQTDIMMNFAKFHSDGKVDTELVRVESEHSAMSCCVGASAAGARAMTATASAGLALMWEILGVASGSRLPIAMAVVNRALSSPINIHCDHSDSMGCRDHGWIQIYNETNQEAYESVFLAVKLAEKVMLPCMICLDGFITSHGVQNVTLHDDKQMKGFVRDYEPKKWLLNTDDPHTVGPLELQDYYFETQKQRADAMIQAKEEYLKIGKELARITGNEYPLFEEYQMDDAEAVVIVMNSTAGNTKAVIDKMRKDGKKVGLLKPRLFRPFPYKEIAEALKHKKYTAVLDRSESYGANAPLYAEIKSALYEADSKPKLKSYIFGLGGRNILEPDIEKVYDELLSGKFDHLETGYIGLRGE
ncbi:pyruvate ferredoxin oxidoreductase [Candidatus Woesearchaeota archaeon]|nr:pyruvate ferredoxin oxidoreductase [Candidatus Woesearchaeota archaeon]